MNNGALFRFSPLGDALFTIVGKRCPYETAAVWQLEQLTDEDAIAIQDWCSGEARPSWATGESIVDYAFLMIERAVENANLEVPENLTENGELLISGKINILPC